MKRRPTDREQRKARRTGNPVWAVIRPRAESDVAAYSINTDEHMKIVHDKMKETHDIFAFADEFPHPSASWAQQTRTVTR